MQNIGNRLKSIRTEKRLTQQGLADIIQVSKQAVANIESGHNKPSIEFISKLIENLNINSNWLIAGKGSMFNAPKYEDVKDEILKEVEGMLRKRGIT